ncbi:hypothetical protein SAMN05421812_103696 [Asanoa hainanensis]|uniref:Uncharacterized protein n=1 Tax=Asanoa hainanensis TaxID=560556 RepID=A0A239KQT2_9ACTN|nr:hypothetical protein [Asanoa hainanensis]SNT20092.1 hypothetical protein SAMN05421812_103696 [Asanoa hainanensis]
MQNVELTNLLVNFVKQLASDPTKALQFAQNPQGELVASGITEHDLSGLDMPAIVQQACGEPDFPADARGALQSYTSGGGGGGGGYSPPAQHVTSGPQSMEQVVQHLTYVTQVTNNDNDVITQILDQSTNVEVGDDFDGDIDVDSNAANASGAGAVAVGEADDVNAATGANSQVVDGDIEGDNLFNSDGAVSVDGDLEAPVVTGTNTGIVADGDVDRAIIGNNNEQQANDVDVDGDNDGVINFGDGDVNNVNDSTLDNSNVGSGTNIADNDDSAIGLGDGDVTNEDNDTTITETTNIDADDSVVNTEQGPGDQDADFEVEVDFDRGLPPVRTLEESDEPSLRDADDHEDAPA